MTTKSRPRPRPAQAIAEARIRALLESGGPVPSMKRIAALAGVSLVSVWSAARQLRDAGVIQIRPRVGIRRIDPAAVSASDNPEAVGLEALVPARGSKWHRIAERLRYDTLTGTLGASGRLPSAKLLCARYACSYRTMRKAVAALESCMQGGADRAVSQRGRGSIVLIAWGYDDGRVRHLNPWSEPHLRMLERECVRAGVALRVVTFGEAHRQPFYLDRSGRAMRTLPRDAGVLGYCLWTLGSPVSVRHAFDEVRATGLPAALLDEEGTVDTEPLVRLHRHARAFRFSTGERPASLIGAYLAGLGHRRIAYISGLHRAVWSQVRLEGLRKAFGTDVAARTIVTHTLGVCRDIENYFDDPSLEARVCSAIQSCLGGSRVRNATRRATIERFCSNVASRCSAVMQQETMSAALAPLFEQALADPRITAWVCAHDAVALPALRFLREHDVAVPERISVVGFDDSSEALRADLTSVNFNIEGLVHAMVSHVLRPGLTPKSSMPLEVDAQVMVRGSSGPGRQGGRVA